MTEAVRREIFNKVNWSMTAVDFSCKIKVVCAEAKVEEGI